MFWSHLNYAIHYTYDVCQFQRWFSKSRKLHFVMNKVKYHLFLRSVNCIVGSVGDSGVFSQTPLSSFHRNEWGSASNTVSSNKNVVNRLHPKVFIYATPPLHADNMSTLCMAEFSTFNLVLPLDQSRAEVIKTQIYCSVNWPGGGGDADFTHHSHCPKKAWS